MPQRLNSFFKSSQSLSQISGKVRQLRILQQHYEQVAPPSLLRASRVIHLENNLLAVAADNGAIAAKLRQMAPELVTQLQLLGCEVTGIQVRVQVSQPRAAPSFRASAISQYGKQQLDKFAETLLDSPLKSALKRLIRNKK